MRASAGRPPPSSPPAGIVRGLLPIERGKVRDHLLRLDGEDRLLRFGGYVSDAWVAAYCDELDWNRTVVVGYLVGGEVRGVGELKPLDGGGRWPRAGEVAASVERPFRNRGVGTELLRSLIVAARNRLITRLHTVCLLENGPALRLARRLDGALTVRDGTAEARLELPGPTPVTLFAEWLDGAGAVLSAALHRAAGSAGEAAG